VAGVLSFHVPADKETLRRIWDERKSVGQRPMEPRLPDDERVEDAGLEFDETTIRMEEAAA
jgi:hypothetical protein